MKISEITIAPNETHHLYQGEAFYPQRYHSVLKFHAPGVSPVTDDSGAYHIDLKGKPLYYERFEKTFGFYSDIAAVKTAEGWCHISLSGQPIYQERYLWCGNYQDGYCVVENSQHEFFHINQEGQALYINKYAYVGDFRDGIAVVQNQEGFYTHITQSGELLHAQYFLDLDVYHKGFARAKDQNGYCHIDMHGNPIYTDRYQLVEPFYNGIARVEREDGAILRINESGKVLQQLRAATNSLFQQLSADMVGYWRTQTIKAAVDLNLFDHLPATLDALSQSINLSKLSTRRLLRALKELNLIKENASIYYLTDKSEYLTDAHPMTLKSAAKHWTNANYITWSKLGEALKQEQSVYESLFDKPIFSWLDKDEVSLSQYQQALSSYALHDYKPLCKKINFSNYNSVIDAAGGTGTLLECVLNENNHMHGILLERASVIPHVKFSKAISSRVTAKSFDLFQPWPEKSDLIFLARVLHDWNDEQCGIILKNASESLNKNSEICIIEFSFEENTANGGMLDLNMLLIAGGKERTLDEYISLCNSVGLQYIENSSCGSYNLMRFKKHV